MTKKKRVIYQKELNHSIVKSNLTIKEFLFKRWTELGLLFSEVVKDAQKENRNITSAQLSRYINTSYQVVSGLSEVEILWLCEKYNIKVTLQVEYGKDKQ